jgi:lipid-A-disaccharide synthase
MHGVRILISAGEASGDMYGAQLINALRRRDPQIEFFGVAGEKMRAAGCDAVVDARELAVVGITEILSHLPKIWGLFHKLIRAADARKPDVAVVIDSPAFNWRVARQMRKRGIPVVYYVCPQFWAWRQGRVRLLRRYVDLALVIFPFEKKFYRDRGVNTLFVGHPLAQTRRPEISRSDYARQHALDEGKPWIVVMPGSRRKEVRLNLPVILESMERLGPGYEFLLPVAPTLDRAWLRSLAEGSRVHLVGESLPALAHSRAGIIASGTATVEAALMELPFVMVYRVSRLTYLLGKHTVKVPHFAMVNLIAGKKVVPELVQDDFTSDGVVQNLSELLAESPQRAKMIDELQEVKRKMSGALQQEMPPAEKAAELVLQQAEKAGRRGGPR